MNAKNFYKYGHILKEIKYFCHLRDGSKCILCGHGSRLKMHHIVPHRNKVRLLVSAKNIVLLCDYCHVECAHAGDKSGHKICPTYKRLFVKYIKWEKRQRKNKEWVKIRNAQLAEKRRLKKAANVVQIKAS